MPQPRYRPEVLPRRISERRRRRVAVLGGSMPEPSPSDRPALRASAGTIRYGEPGLLVLGAGGGTRDGAASRVPLTDTTTIWHGGRADPDALRPGRQAVVRHTADGLKADRIWIDIVRVSGTIVSVDSRPRRQGTDQEITVVVDAGPHRGRHHVAIPKRALCQVLVRHPRLEPGYLFDVIAVRSPDGPLAVRPATSQPGYPAGHPAKARIAGPVPRVARGTATWFDGVGRGAAYPAVDAEGQAGGCPDAPAGCTALPFLSYGSDVSIRNDCTNRSARLPIIECGCTAARFCDRCVTCDASERGRIVELTATSFVELGGDLDAGCFNATLRLS